MKMCALAATAAAVFGLSNAPVHAATDDPQPVTSIPDEFAVECGEGGVLDEEGNPTVEPCVDFYVDIEVQPPATTVPDVTTTTEVVVVPPEDLPRTGGGVSPILGIGALLFVGGGVIVVASRRRSGASPSAA